MPRVPNPFNIGGFFTDHTVIFTHEDYAVIGEYVKIEDTHRWMLRVSEAYSHTTAVVACSLNIEAAYLAAPYILDRERNNNIATSAEFWKTRFSQPGSVIINGSMYFPGKRFPGKRTASGPYRSELGMGGRRFDIEFLSGGRITTFDLWHSGEIPARYRLYCPDNARFLSGAEKVKLPDPPPGGFTHCFESSSDSDLVYSDWDKLPEPVADSVEALNRVIEQDLLRRNL